MHLTTMSLARLISHWYQFRLFCLVHCDIYVLCCCCNWILGLKSTAVSLSHLDSCLKAVVKVISALSRSLQLKQMRNTDNSPTLSNCQSETGGYQSRLKVTAVAALDSFSTPINRWVISSEYAFICLEAV